jgi:predicted GNAT family N-acyltransferase
MPPTIQKYQATDRDSCLAVFDSNCPSAFADWERPEFKEWLELKTDVNPYWTIRVDDVVIGCGGIYTSDDHHKDSRYGREAGFAWGMVRSDIHGRGYGKQLFQHRLDYLLAGYRDWPIILRTSQTAYTFFEQFGFKTVEYTEDGWAKGLHKYEMQYEPG